LPRSILPVSGIAVWFAPLEYVIVRKLQWHDDSGSTRHLDDVRAVLRVSGEGLDRAALEHWVSRLGLDTEWRAVTR